MAMVRNEDSKFWVVLVPPELGTVLGLRYLHNVQINWRCELTEN